MSESSILANQQNSPPPGKSEVAFSSNSVRLTGYEFLFVVIITLVLYCFGPAIWERIEKFEPAADFRLPYELSNDYWLYDRCCRQAVPKYETLIIGDSVIWGHYVPPGNTLSHNLNQIAGQDRFANLGVDGIHPVALSGLLKYYGSDISGKKVVLHFNPLWMSSDKQDLQTAKEFRFNHPRLAPQFTPKIPCYKESFSKRFSIAAERYVPVFNWTFHLKITYFQNMDIPSWTLKNPYKNPANAVTLEIPAPSPEGRDEHISWIEKATPKKDFPWVELETSMQWKFFRRSVELLEKRGNKVFVLVGPFNEHMLKGNSIEIYRKIKSEIEIWLKKNNIPFYIAPVLPSELYADASHPLKDGYAMLAKQLYENESFMSCILSSRHD